MNNVKADKLTVDSPNKTRVSFKGNTKIKETIVEKPATLDVAEGSSITSDDKPVVINAATTIVSKAPVKATIKKDVEVTVKADAEEEGTKVKGNEDGTEQDVIAPLVVSDVSAVNETQVVIVELNRPFVAGDKEVTIEGYTLEEPAVGKTELVFNPEDKVKNDTTESKDVVVKVLLGGEQVDKVTIVVAGESQRLVNGLKDLDAEKLGFLSTRVHVGKKDSEDTAEVVINRESLIKAYTVKNLTAGQLHPGLDFNTNNVSKNRLVVFEDLIVEADGFNLVLNKEGDDLVLGSETKMSETLFKAIKAQDGALKDNKYNITITKGFNATTGEPGAKDKIARIVFSLEGEEVVAKLEPIVKK